MADHLQTRLSALSDTPVPPLLPPDAIRARGDQRGRRQAAAYGATAVLVAALLGGGVVLGGQDPQDALQVATPPTSSPTTAPTPTVTSPPTPTPTASPTPSAVPSPTTGPAQTPPSPPAPTPPAPTFPEQTAPEHGGTRSAVYLAVAYDSADPELAQAQARAREAGYAQVGLGEVSCDQGAREALGLAADRTYYAVALYFADRPTAQQFVDAYEPGVVGIADVRTYCLD